MFYQWLTSQAPGIEVIDVNQPTSEQVVDKVVALIRKRQC
jgi:hypothetical protein